MLQEEVEDLGVGNLKPDLEKIVTAAKHQLGLVNDILDLSRIESGKMTLFVEEFELCKTVAEVVATVQPLVGKNENRLEVDCPADLGRMRSDETKVRQILFNLLSNACKFTRSGVIRVAVWRQAAAPLARETSLNSPSATIHFTVNDTGIGMSPEQLSRVFHAFAQADASTARNYGGTGLGLALSRKMCELMGGELNATSALGKGSTFEAILPAFLDVSPAAVPSENGVAAAAISQPV
jgi:signal transduction histidine kinase